MHTFESPSFRVHMSSDGSGVAKFVFAGQTFGLAAVGDDVVKLAIWLLKRTGHLVDASHVITQKAQIRFSLGDVCTVDVSLPASQAEQLSKLRDRWADVDEIRLDLPDGSHCTWPTNYPCHNARPAPGYLPLRPE